MGKNKKKAGSKRMPTCVTGFAELCSNGWKQGWHERNGGNLSYRLTEEDLAEIAQWSSLYGEDQVAWNGLSQGEPVLGGTWLMVTGSGCHLRKVATSPRTHIGIIEMNDAGNAWRLRWGFEDGGRPTSEFPTHLAAHAVRMEASDRRDRVVYHAHTPNLIALGYVLPADDREVTRALWKTLPECVMTVPEGVGVVGWGSPGSQELADATRAKMGEFPAVLWALHGLFCAGASFDETFGLAHTLEKAAQIYRYARQMNGGSDGFWQTIPDDGLRACAKAAGMVANERFLADGPSARVCGFVGPHS